MAASLVLPGHVALLLAWERPPLTGARAAALQVRQLRQVQREAPVQAATPTRTDPRPAPLASQLSAAAPDRPPAAPPSAPAAADPPAPGGGVEVPVYATRLPPAATLDFEVRRGGAGGRATLRWEPGEGEYTLTLRGEGAAGPAAGRSSRGRFDAAGVAPERYAEGRRGREQRAANFQREAGRISFSASTAEHPLVAGAQDRLSWMPQLAAVVAANPALSQPGAQVRMVVAGTRGDAEVWAFEVGGWEPVELADGSMVSALKLQREPLRPYDTQVQVWLDPQRHLLPARLRLVARGGGEGSDWRLRPDPLP